MRLGQDSATDWILKSSKICKRSNGRNRGCFHNMYASKGVLAVLSAQSKVVDHVVSVTTEMIAVTKQDPIIVLVDAQLTGNEVF